VTDAKLTRNDARPDAGRGHLDDLQPDVVGQGPAVDEDAAELVDAALTFETNKLQKKSKKLFFSFFPQFSSYFLFFCKAQART